MSRTSRTPLAAATVAALAALAVGLTPSVASADLLGQFNVGVKGGMNLNLLSKPNGLSDAAPGFVGLAGGFGLALEALAFDVVGLELDVFFANTEGKGDVEYNGVVNIEHKLTTSELQIPLLLKAQIPVALVKPFIGLGITWVRQSEATYVVGEGLSVDTDVGDLTSNYAMWTFALGAAIDLNYVRVPIEFRGLYQSLDNTLEERAILETSGNQITKLGIYPKWEGQVWVLVGVEFSRGLDVVP